MAKARKIKINGKTYNVQPKRKTINGRTYNVLTDDMIEQQLPKNVANQYKQNIKSREQSLENLHKKIKR